jgi:hypothetical protein
MCMSHLLIYVFLKNLYALFYFRDLNLHVVSKNIFGFRGTPLLLMVCLGLDRSILTWVCDKHRFSGSFAVVIRVLKENGEKFENRD